MPGKDTTGSQGKGPRSGRDFGDCDTSKQPKQNRRYGGQRGRNQGNGQCRRNRGQDQESNMPGKNG